MRVILCEDVGLDTGTCTTWDDGADCPNRATHTPMPSGYGSWHHRAEALARTHDQQRCPSCGLWAIWVPKARTHPPEPTADEWAAHHLEPDETDALQARRDQIRGQE